MSANGEAFVTEQVQPVESVAARMEAMRANLAGARAQGAHLLDAQEALRRELRRQVRNLREEEKRVRADLIPGDVIAAVVSGLVTIMVLVSLSKSLSEKGESHGTRGYRGSRRKR